MPFIAQVAVGRRDKLTVYGSDYDTVDGTGVRDYLHVMDLAIGHVLALNVLLDPKFHGVKVYNLGTGKGNIIQICIKQPLKSCNITIIFYDNCSLNDISPILFDFKGVSLSLIHI